MEATSGLIVPRIDASTSWLMLEEETSEARFLVLVAQVLGVDTDKILVHESFRALGGDEQSAVALRKLCMDAGMDVTVKDILRCSTISELQACVVPCAPQADYDDEVDNAEPVMIAPLEIHKPSSRQSDRHGANGEHSRSSSRASLASQTVPKIKSIEEAVGTQPEVAKIATVRPKAGLLEGKLVALLTLTNAGSSDPNPPTINLIPQSHALYAGTQVANLRQLAETTLAPDAIPDIWIVLDGMPLTESGDIDMRRLRTWAQNINEDVHHQALTLEHHETLQPPTSDMEKSLQRLVGKVLDVPQGQIGVNFSFCQLGGDETTARELAARCKHESIHINVSEALGSTTLSELASIAASRGGLAHKWDEETSDCFDLSPMQHLYFQTPWGGDLAGRASSDGSYRFNQSMLLRFNKPFSFEDVAAAVEAIVGHHPMLRSRYGRALNGTWVQRVLPDVPGSYSICHSSIRSDRELEDIIERTQISINVETGPIFAVDFLTTDDGTQMLYLAAHHLAVDLTSWRTIIHDIDELLENGSFLSQRSMPFHKWVDLQKEDALGPDPKDLLPFAVRPGDYAYWGMQDVPNTYGDVVDAGFSLSQELTSILHTSCNQVFQTDGVEIYLAALMLSFAQTFYDRPVPVVWNQEHGREPWNPDIDIGETVGWFTSLCPISEKVEASDDFVTVLRHLKDTRRSIPTRGAQYFASRFYYDKEQLSHDWPFEIVFSYTGSLQHLERDNGVMEQDAIPGRTLASPTSDIGPQVGRIALFEISAMIDQGSAKIKFWYNRYSKDQTRIAQWVHNFEHLILEAIGRLRYHPQELTLADVPHLDVTYEGLAKFNKHRLETLKLNSVRDVETIYPVTAVQQSILVSQAQRPDTCYLHAIYEFASPNGDPIDTSRICTAWEQVTMRHAALRTVFTESVSETGLWDRVILRRASPEMLFIDTAPSEDPVYELSNLPNLRPTHSKPLHRLTVCKAPTRTFVKLDISTALCDSLSIHLLLHDLRRAYATERAIPEPEQFSYPQYLNFLNNTRQESSLAFWREKLSGVTSCLFPRLTVRPEEQRFVNACLELDVTSYELAAFARTHKTKICAILRLAWGLILRCFTGSNYVCFGYQTAGRDESIMGIRSAVGSFANTVACNYELLTYSPLTLALHKAEEHLNESLPHQHFTMAELRHALGMKGGEKLFNTCLTFTEEPAGLNSKFTTRTSFELKPISLQQTFDMDVVINTRFAAGKLMVDIGQRVMSAEQSLNVASTFGKAIRAILATPNVSVGLVDLFGDRDLAQILAWDAESPQQTDGQTQCVVHELIRTQASLQPNAQAVCSWDGSFTYEQLDEEATKLAHHLVDAGVGPHSVVPVVMDKNRLAPLAMLAVLKSGAAFVPIDSLELGMIQPISERLNSRVVISSEHAAQILGNLFEQVLIVNDELLSTLRGGQGSLTSMAAPTDPACILFVPTSSNEAKGVSFSHAALSTALIGQAPAARITPLSRVMQLSSFNVDICITEIFTTLAYGGCVCVPSATERLSDFTAAVNRMQVNWTYMTPLLSRKLDPSIMPSLQVVCFRTRSLDEDTYNIWHGKVTVVLAYGPQDACPLGIAFLEAAGPQHLRSIGRAFSGSLLIVNPEDHKKRVPVGAVGELVVEGPTLGFSYPNRESTITPMTPLGAAGTKTRYFKTGHRARYTEGGLMEFIPGKREGVEVNGKLINVTEVEQHLRRCLGPGIDVIVDSLTFRGAKSDAVLAAFVEFGDKLEGEENLTSLSSSTKEQLIKARQLVEVGLRSRVPPWMIPTIYIPVKHLPITPSLKVNRRRLQKLINGLAKEDLYALSKSPKSAEATSAKPLPQPLTRSEEKMRTVWAKVLGVEEAKIATSDTFFGAGGDDIVAAQLVTACRHEGITVSIADVLRNPTLFELSRIVAAADSPSTSLPQQSSPGPVSTSTSPSPAPPTGLNNPNALKRVFIERVIAPKIGIDGSAIEDAAEASSVQIRYIETGMLRGRANINYLIFNFSSAIDTKRLEEACKTLVVIHPILRTVFVPDNRRVYQAVLKSAEAEFKRQFTPSWRLTSMLEKTIRKDQTSPITFVSPMTKFMFLDGGKQSTLILRLSKAQYDDLSIALLVKDLKRLYDGTQAPPRRPTYCDFVRCAQILNSNGAEDYWRSLLEGAVMTQIVAHTQPYPVTSNHKTIRQTLPMPGSLANLGIAFDTVLKAAWGMVLASLSASSDIVFGELVDGRQIRLPGNQSVAGVMGPTVNAVPVRVQFPEAALTPISLLQYIHAQRISSIPFENLGTLSIVEKCTPWPYWTRFSSLLQHQLEETAINPFEPKSFHLGTTACKFTITESKAQDVPDMFVRSLVRHPDRVEMSITFCTDRVPETFADHALRQLCATISNLTAPTTIMQPIIPSAADYRAKIKRLPLPPTASLAGSSGPVDADAISSLSQKQIVAIQTIITNTWTSILNPLVLGVPEPQVHTAAFFDLWGSLIPAAQMMAQLNRELPKGIPGANAGLRVTMEEIVQHPTMEKQFELIASKIKPGTAPQAPKGKDKDKEAEKAEADTAKAAPPQPQPPKRKPTMGVSVPATSSLSNRIRRFASTVGRTNSPPVGRTTPTPPPQQPPATPTSPGPVAIGIASQMVRELVSPMSSPRIISNPNGSPGIATSINTARANQNSSPNPREPPQPPSQTPPQPPQPMSQPPPPPPPSVAPPQLPNLPPQLPSLPAFEPIAEEDEEESPVAPRLPLPATLAPASTLAVPTSRQATPQGHSSSADSMTDGSSASSHHTAQETPAR